MLYLKQSTASQSVLIGPFVDDTDGATAETGLTIANTDIRLSKNGGNLAAKTSGGGTHDEAGWYQITLDATDTNTVGMLQLHCKVAGALMVHAEFMVLEEAIYDALIGSGAAGFDSNGRVDVGSWLGTAVTLSATTAKPQVDVDSIDDDATAANNLELDYDGTGYNKSNSTIGTTTTNTDMRGTDSAALASAYTAARAGYLDNLNIGENVAGTSEISALNNLSSAEVIAALEDAGQLLVNTTIATLASQTSFTLTAGSADDDAYNGCIAVIEDVSTAAQKAIGLIQDYTGLSKTVTLAADPGIFTMAATDKISILPPSGVLGWLTGVVNALVSGRVDADVGAKTGNVALSAQEKLDVNAEADTALTDYDALVPADLPTNFSSMGIEADGHVHADVKEWTGNTVTASASGLPDTNVNEIEDSDATDQINAAVDTAFTTQMADSVATDGTIATREQALYMVLQFLTERAYSGTTCTVKKVDGSTSLYTLTLDDGTNPTSVTRS